MVLNESATLILIRDNLLPEQVAKGSQFESLQTVFTYWKALCSEAATAPVRSSFKPMDIAKHLSFITMAERIEDEKDWHIKVAGTEHDTKIGLEFNNRKISEVPNSRARDAISLIYSEVQEHHCPLYYSNILANHQREYTRMHTLLMPFKDEEGIKVTHILGINAFEAT